MARKSRLEQIEQKSPHWSTTVKDQLEALINRMIENGIQYPEAVSEFEKRFIQRMLEKNNGNQSKTAQALGIHRNTLSRKREDLGLDHRPKRRRRPSP
jgi:DNA-binding NtrC family response regulator